MRTIIIAALVAMTFLLQADPSVAQTAQSTWPSRAIRLILPTVPGGGTDILARTLQNAVEIGRAHV